MFERLNDDSWAASESQLQRNGCKLHYWVQGSGPAVLMIQGVGVQGYAWKPQMDALSKDCQCIAFDNRGMGKSQPVGSEISVELLAQDALAILDAQRIESAHVIGHSLGGLIALQLALCSKARVRSLSLLCTFPSGRMAAPLTLRMIWLGLRSQLGTVSMRRRGFMKLVHPPGAIRDFQKTAEQLARLFGHDLGKQPDIVPAQLRAMKRTDLLNRLGELNAIPTLVVSARHDPIAPPKAGLAIHTAIQGSRYVEIADASHGLPITHASQVNQLLASHLK